jgi:hypothetical protein
MHGIPAGSDGGKDEILHRASGAAIAQAYIAQALLVEAVDPVHAHLDGHGNAIGRFGTRPEVPCQVLDQGACIERAPGDIDRITGAGAANVDGEIVAAIEAYIVEARALQFAVAQGETAAHGEGLAFEREVVEHGSGISRLHGEAGLGRYAGALRPARPRHAQARVAQIDPNLTAAPPPPCIFTLAPPDRKAASPGAKRSRAVSSILRAISWIGASVPSPSGSTR